jgi:AhpD family alkylhydroperoxidase
MIFLQFFRIDKVFLKMDKLRIAYRELSSEAYKGFIATKDALDKSPIGIELLELIYLRVSQINGCAFCLEMHATALRKGGTSDKKIDSLAGWRVSPHFSEKEYAAFAWTESLVDIAQTHAPEHDFQHLKQHFNDREISDICFAVSLMSAFNRLAIGVRQ